MRINKYFININNISKEFNLVGSYVVYVTLEITNDLHPSEIYRMIENKIINAINKDFNVMITDKNFNIVNITLIDSYENDKKEEKI